MREGHRLAASMYLKKSLIFAIGALLCLLAAKPAVAALSDVPAGRLETVEIMQGELLRRFDIYIPASASATKPRSLVFVLHGGWMDKDAEKRVKSGKPAGKTMSKLTGGTWEKLAERENIVIVYPVAVNARWNDGAEETKAITHDTDDVGFISLLIDALAPAFGIDRARVYSTGFSNGAKMSFRLGCELSDKIAAIAPVDGGIAPEYEAKCHPRHPVPAAIFHGTKYPVVMTDTYKKQGQDPIALFHDSVALWTKLNRCPSAPVETNLPNDKRDGTTVTKLAYEGCKRGDVLVYRINDGGHVWPGGSQYLPRFLIGNGSREIDAAVESWNFLKNHRREK